MAFRESAQAQARHTIQNTKVKAGGLAKSLRDQRHRVQVMGVLGVMHQQFGGQGGPAKVMHSMFEAVEGLDGDEKDVQTLAETIYVSAVTGDELTLEKALVPLFARWAVPEVEEENKEPPPPDPRKGGKADPKKGAGEPEPGFDPALALGSEKEAPRAWSIRDARGIEPLALAAERGHAGALRLLLDAKADVHAKAKTCGRSALHRAAEAGHLECVSVLVERGADVLSSQQNGECALHSASAGGCTELVAALLASGAAVEQCDLHGMSPLMAASECGHLGACNVLIASAASVNAVDNIGWRALHYAARGGHEECAIALFRAGSEVSDTRGGNNLRDLNGGIAAKVDELVRLMSSSGAAGGDEDEDDADDEQAGRPLTAP